VSVDIIPIEEKHIAGFNAAVGEVARERLYLSFFDAFPMEGSRKFVMNNIANGNPQFVAILDNKVIGWCDINPNTSRVISPHCATMGMGILPPYRGQGIGKKLLAAALDAAKKKGILRVDLTVRATNLNAIKLYEKFGFVHEGTMRKEACVDGLYYDTHMMALLFPPLA
jgi:RimJ/RimL family protein N-acetyltransferase